jgi:IS66 Orf2 like protein
VIGPTGAARVMVATKPVDFRKSAEGLAALVREEMKADPFGLCVPSETGESGEADLLGWDWSVPVRQSARGWQVPLAECAGQCDAVVGCGARGFAGRAPLAAGSRDARDAGTDAAGMIAAE